MAEATLDTGVALEEPRSLWRTAISRLIKNKLALGSFFAILLFVFVAVFAPVLAPWPYDFQSRNRPERGNGGIKLPPAWVQTGSPATSGKPGFILGTDHLGRDKLSRLIMGTSIAIAAGIVPLLIALPLGLLVGVLAGYCGGKVDQALMRLTDVIFAFPSLLFVLLTVVTLRLTPLAEPMNGMLLIFLALGLTGWVEIARMARGQLLSLREQEFVIAAHSVGIPSRRIITRHLLPNAAGPLIVVATNLIPAFVVTEVILEYMGIGGRPPFPTWGGMITEGLLIRDVDSVPNIWLPALCIAMVTLAFTLLGDGLRDVLDPKSL